MSSISIPNGKLRNCNDERIPLLGFGLAEFPFGSSPPEAVKDSVLCAIRLGYRHFDTASVYKSEEPLGEAISDALRLGIIKSRDELFITSKLYSCDALPDLVLPALLKTLRNLKLEYLDLYLIHFPISYKRGHYDVPMKKDYFMPMDINATWEAMEECQNLGLTKSIGVSNFTCKKLQTLLATSKIPPAVNQVEINPLWHQKKLREFCEERGIHVSGYSPLGGRGTIWGRNTVLDSEILNQIADANGKTVAQVCLRWAYQQGISVIMKSFNRERMAENLGIFDWELSQEDLQKISEIPQSRGWTAQMFVSDQGPYKSLKELWDGEI